MPVDFKCGVCKQASGRNVFGGKGVKYKCPKHKDVCHRCITGGFLSSERCVKCDSKVTTYEYSDTYKKWLKYPR